MNVQVMSRFKFKSPSGYSGLGVFLGAMLALGLQFAKTASANNVPDHQSGFDAAIEQVGGIKKGQVSYLSFSNQFNPKLDAANRKNFSDMINNSAFSNKTYSYAEADLNGDGKKEAFVQINNSWGSGSGGFHTWVFKANQDSYELVNIFLHQVSLVILQSNTSGWQDILVVPGKIFTPNYGAFYYQCSYNPVEKWDSYSEPRSPNHYRDCQKVQQESHISGTVINTSTFRRNYPKFDLALPN